MARDNDAPRPARSTTNTTDSGTTAVVIGAGMGGLAAAQVLSRHFDHVVVLERDAPPPANAAPTAAEAAADPKHFRPGVAQYHHLHALLGKGLQLLDSFFDGRFSKAVLAAGAHRVNNLDTMLFLHPKAGLLPWARHPDAPPCTVCLATRHTVETTARQLLSDNPRVELRHSAAVMGLVFGDGTEEGGASAHATDGTAPAAAADAPRATKGKSVTGVMLADGTTLPAQLVVDCSGRGSGLPGWLAAEGYPRPHTSRAGCNCGYASWLCKLDPKVEQTLLSAGVSAVNMLPCAPDHGTMFLMLRAEGGAWLVGLGGNEGVHPGTKDEQLMEFAREKAWHPIAGRLLAGSTQLSPACRRYGITSTWRRYDSIAGALPDGVLPMADACCAFNPVYGQGMTVAAIEADALDHILQQRAAAHRTSSSTGGGNGNSNSTGGSSSDSASGTPAWLRGLNKEFQAAVVPIVQASWQLAAGGDMRYPSAEANEPIGRSFGERLVGEYIQLVFAASADDPVVNETFIRVINMLQGPETLMRPRVLARVLLSQGPSLLRGAVQALAARWLPVPLGFSSPATKSDATAAGSVMRRSNEPRALLELIGAA